MAKTNFVQQSGKVTPGHLSKWVTDGVIQDGGFISTLDAVLVSGIIIAFDTRNDAQAATIPNTVTAVQTYGYATVGDGGSALYVNAVGSTTGGFQSHDGAWWKLATQQLLNVAVFAVVGDGVTDDTSALNIALTYAAATGAKLFGDGSKTYLISGSGITADLKLIGGFDWRGATINYSSGSGIAITFATANTGNVFHTQAHPFENFILIGPGSTGIGISCSIGNPSDFASITVVVNAYIGGFASGITWGDNAFSNSFINIFVQGCTTGLNYPSSISGSGERIDFYASTIANCTVGIFCHAGEIHFRGSIDYCTNNLVFAEAGSNVWTEGHLESNFDNDYWIISNDVQTAVNIINCEIAITGAKTSFPFGHCGGSQFSQINFGENVTLFNAAGAGWNSYQFGYLVDGFGNPGLITWVATGDAAAPATHNTTSALVDGGFEKGSLTEWINIGTTATTVVSTAPHSGTYCLEQAPTAGTFCGIIKLFDCGPGDQPVISFWLKTSGIVGDEVDIELQYNDETYSGVSPGGNSLVFTSTNAPTSWTNYKLRPFNPAPNGTKYLRIVIQKFLNGGGGSDGNGAAFYDDIIVENAFKSVTPQSFSTFLAASDTPTFQKQMVIEATSNTELTIKYLGTDNVDRTTALTLGAGPPASPLAAQLLTNGAPAGPSSTIAYTMEGLNTSFTVNTTGRLLVLITGYIVTTDTVAGSGLSYKIQWGLFSGGVPSYGDAITGTTAGSTQTYTIPATITAADLHAPFAITTLITGLTAGVSYWVDLAAIGITDGNTSLAGVNVVVVEV